MRYLMTLVLAALLAACGSLGHDNPYDPATPPAQQARARLTGQVALEPVGTGAPALNGIHVSIPGTSMAADTDATGAFAIAGVPAGTWSIQAVKSGWVDGLLTGIAVTLEQGGHDVVVPPFTLGVARGSVEGQVTFDDGMGHAGVPLAGASVSLVGIPGAATSDADGQYLLSGVPVGTHTLQVTRDGFQEATSSSFPVLQGLVAPAPDVPMAWNPGGVSGTVSVQGAPDGGGVTVRVSGVTVAGTPYEATTTSAPDGHYGLVGLVPAGTYNLAFELRDYGAVATAAMVAPGATTALPAVELVRDTGAVVGVARLEGAGDHSGIQVSLTPPATVGNPSPLPVAAALTDATGNWRADLLPVNTYAIAYQRQPGYLSQTGSVTVVGKATVTAAQVTLAAIPGALHGNAYLEDAAAGGHGGTTVRIAGATGLLTTTSATGAWTLTGVGAGAHLVVMERTGYDPQQAQVVLGPGDEVTLLDVTLAVSRGDAAGVTTAAGAASSAGIVVTVSGGSDTQTGVTDASGAWSVRGLRAGTGYTARFDRQAYSTASSAAFAITAHATTAVPPVTLQLATGGQVAGVAAVERGTADGILVSLSGRDLNGATVTRSTTTSTGGIWSITGLPQGTYALTYSKSGYDPGTSPGIAVAGGAVTAPAVTLLVSRGVVEGTVSVSAGGLAGFPVTSQQTGIQVALTAAGLSVAPTVTDASGHFRFEGVPVSLPPGAAYTITATKPFFRSSASTVTVAGNATSPPAGPLALVLATGSLTGTARLWDNVAGSGVPNAVSSGVTISVTGTAFDGTSWSASTTTAASGSWTVTPSPPGSFAVLATIGTTRSCEPYATTTTVPPDGVATVVAQSATAPLYPAIRCVDTVPPTAVLLGTPVVPAGAQPGYTNLTSISVPISVASTDGNLRGYQVLVGSAADWSAATLVPVAPTPPTALAFSPLAANTANTLRVRPIDWVGNAGPESSVVVVQDQAVPATPTMRTSRAVVNATTATVILTGSDADANFARYETFVSTVAAIAACPAAPSGPVWAASPDSASVNLTGDLKNCVYARGVDRAGNTSAAASLAILSDLTPPTPPTLVPTYDPSALTVNADDVSFFVVAGSTDLPAGAPTPWAGIAWLEVDSGTGFTPLCPADTCHDGAGYDPCSCGCTDARLRCSADAISRFLGVNVPLRSGSVTNVSVRAVDLAGNVGSSVTQPVTTSGTGGIVTATTDWEYGPHMRGNLVVWSRHMADLGSNRRLDPTDPTCAIGDTGYAGEQGSQVGSSTLVVYPGYSGTYQVQVRRPGATGWCTTDSVTSIRSVPAGSRVSAVAAGGEWVAWVETLTSSPYTSSVYVRDPGADGLIGTGDDPAPFAAMTGQTFGGLASSNLTVAGRRLLYRHDPGTGAIWTVVSAAAGGYAAGRSYFDLPSTVLVAALSPDGERLVTGSYSGATVTLSVRRPSTPGGVYGAGDLIASKSYTANITSYYWSIATDGPHVIALDNYQSGTGYITDWFAGGDGTFGTTDDTLVNTVPSATMRFYPSVSNGLLVYQNNQANLSEDVLWLDLTQLRWDVADGSPLSWPISNGEGGLVFQGSGVLRARTSSGGDATLPGGAYHYGYTAGATGPYYLNASGLFRVTAYRTDATGLWFTPAALAAYPAVDVLTVTSPSMIEMLNAKEGKAIVSVRDGANVHRPYVMEPTGAGGLRTPAVVDVLPGPNVSAAAFTSRANAAVSARYAVFSCEHASYVAYGYKACLRKAGGTAAAPVFSASDAATTTVLLHPTGTPLAGQPYYDVRGLRVAGERILIVQGGTIYVLEAGPDGVLGTSDDVETNLGVHWPQLGQFDMSGSFVVYLEFGDPGGKQVILVDMAAGGASQAVTSHYSIKDQVVVEPSGRVFWQDAAFLNEAIFVRTP